MNVTFSDPMLRLAARQLDVEESMYKADKQALAEAREQKHQANEEAIEKLHEQASCIRQGAYVSGAISVAAGGLQIAGAVKSMPSSSAAPTQAAGGGDAAALADQAKAAEAASAKSEKWARVLSTGGDALGKLAGPADSLVGQSRAKDRETDSAKARSRAEEKGWEADDAAERAQRADRSADARLESLKALLETKREGVAAILAKM